MSKRLLDILSAFADKPVMNMADLTERVGLPVSTAFRLVRTLQDFGMLTSAGGVYRVGPRVLQLADAARSRFDVVMLATPEMEMLAEETGETILLASLVGDQAVAMHVVPGSQAIRFTFDVGVARPLHAGASAKILFAFMRQAHRDRLLHAGQFERRTPQTVTDPDKLRTELTLIRKQGYAVTSDEWEEGALSAAAPVLGGSGIWGLSIVAPTFRVDAPRTKRFTELVVEAASRITLAISGLPLKAAPTPAREAAPRSVGHPRTVARSDLRCAPEID